MRPAAVLLRSPSTISVTCVVDGKAHEITDHAMTVGHTARTGIYYALCGHRVMPAPLVAPAVAACRNCLANLSAGHRPERRNGRKPGRHPVPRRGLSWLRGLLDALIPPTVLLSPPPARSLRQNGRAPTAAGSELTPTSSDPAASQRTWAAS